MFSDLIALSKNQERVFSDLSELVPLFHSPDGERYGVIEVNGHRETWSLDSTVFRNLLDFRVYQRYGNLMPIGEVNRIIRLLKAKAQFEAPEIPVFVRVAFYNGSIFLDLCNEKWEVVKITQNGWRVVQDSPVRFTRARGMLPLPHPQRGGKLEDFKNLTNAQDTNVWLSCLSWVIGTLNPKGPFPILNVEGGSGRAKSAAVRMIRHVIDPSTAPLRPAPDSVRDLMIASKDSWILAFDNLSKVPDWFSDALCRLATGGGFSTRKLFTDGEQFIINTIRPVVINGIDFLPAREREAHGSFLRHGHDRLRRPAGRAEKGNQGPAGHLHRRFRQLRPGFLPNPPPDHRAPALLRDGTHRHAIAGIHRERSRAAFPAGPYRTRAHCQVLHRAASHTSLGSQDLDLVTAFNFTQNGMMGNISS